MHPAGLWSNGSGGSCLDLWESVSRSARQQVLRQVQRPWMIDAFSISLTVRPSHVTLLPY